MYARLFRGMASWLGHCSQEIGLWANLGAALDDLQKQRAGLRNDLRFIQ
jgi:hypothetical protein